MDEKKKRLLTIAFVALNLLIWGVFVAPRIGNFTETISTRITRSESETHIFEQTETSREMLERIEFSTLRDPFEKPSSANSYTAYTYTAATTTTSTSTTTTTLPYYMTSVQTAEDIVELTYTSRFNLESIMEFDGSYIATLSEADHYGSTSTSYNVPYSYRFGESDTTSESVNHMVIEGDTIMEETVVKITGDYVILTKDGLFYKLTFSGGYSVDSAD